MGMRVLFPGEVFSLLHCADTAMHTISHATLANEDVGKVAPILARGPLFIMHAPARITICVDMETLPGHPRFIRIEPFCEHVRVTVAHAHGFEIEADHDFVGEYLIFGEAL